MSDLTKAIKIMLDVHSEQKDKSGEPYILHPLRVMEQMDTEEERITAVLHDVLEDSYYQLTDLEKLGFSETVINNLKILTRSKDQAYEGYITGVKKSPAAAKIKIADLKDNLNVKRLKQLNEEDLERLNKYLKALKVLENEDN